MHHVAMEEELAAIVRRKVDFVSQRAIESSAVKRTSPEFRVAHPEVPWKPGADDPALAPVSRRLAGARRRSKR